MNTGLTARCSWEVRITKIAVLTAFRPLMRICNSLFEAGQGDVMNHNLNYNSLLQIAIEEAKQGLAEGGIPIGAALFDSEGNLLGRGHNRRIQEDDPSIHAETDAFRKAGRQRSYRNTIMVTTLAPCWYCSGLIRQFKIGTVVAGESVNFSGGIEWLRISHSIQQKKIGAFDRMNRINRIRNSIL